MESANLQPTPSHDDINELKAKRDELKRLKEYEKLKAEIADIAMQASNTPNEFDGAMQQPDTEKRLSTKRSVRSITEMIIARVTHMLSPRPVIGNLIGIGVAIIALIMLNTEMTLKQGNHYQHYLGLGLLVFGAIQIIKSSSRSLFIPTLAALVGAVVSHTLTQHETLFTYGTAFYQYLMIAGIIGLGIAVLNID